MNPCSFLDTILRRLLYSAAVITAIATLLVKQSTSENLKNVGSYKAAASKNMIRKNHAFDTYSNTHQTFTWLSSQYAGHA